MPCEARSMGATVSSGDNAMLRSTLAASTCVIYPNVSLLKVSQSRQQVKVGNFPCPKNKTVSVPKKVRKRRQQVRKSSDRAT